jgi:acyl-CoA thioesterase I
MPQAQTIRLTAVAVMASTALAVWLLPTSAQVVLPAALHSDGVTARTRVACNAPAELKRFVRPLAKTAQRLASASALTIVAIGSSSTAGAYASTPAHSYPSRLAIELQQRFPASPIRVINRGVNGDEAGDMLARLDAQVLAEKPDLILWQVGTNSLLRERPLDPAGGQIETGLQRMKATGADIVLIDPQFAPKVIGKPDHEAMLHLLALLAKQKNVDVFPRFAVMRHWREVEGLSFDVFLSSDGLHMNDWSYACIAKLLGEAIAEAGTRSTTLVQTPLPRPIPASASR